MSLHFARNLGTIGQLVRGLGAVGLLIAAGFGFRVSTGLGVVLTISGVFVLFEALRGWCVMRACGIKTRL